MTIKSAMAACVTLLACSISMVGAQFPFNASHNSPAYHAPAYVQYPGYGQPPGTYNSHLAMAGGYPVGPYPTGVFPTGGFPTGGFPATGFTSNHYPRGMFPTGMFPTGVFPTGVFPAAYQEAGASTRPSDTQRTRYPQPLYLRISGPEGMRATFYRNSASARGESVEAPAKVGFRPGYSYRFELSDMKRFPGQLFYPTLEVQGSLLSTLKMRASDFPALLRFTEEDFAKVRAGALIKKIIVLERPDFAFPQATDRTVPLEFAVTPNTDPIFDARERGQPLVIVQMGQRQVSPRELAMQTPSGTILLPGERVLPPPRQAPSVPYRCIPMDTTYDPIAGAGSKIDDYLLHDGGDTAPRVGFNAIGQVRGIDPSDTIAEYQDSTGKRRLAVSNRVSFFIPRFVVVRGEQTLASQSTPVGLSRTESVKGQSVVNASRTVLAHHLPSHVESAQTKQKASGTHSQVGTSVSGTVQGLQITASLKNTGSVVGTRTPPEAAMPPDRPLIIIKWPDKSGGLVGDLITFYIRFTNQGGQPINDVIVSDNLITRFEYVAGSTKADRETNFTIQPNDAGSSQLRWEFPGQLLPGEHGTVSFQVRVR